MTITYAIPGTAPNDSGLRLLRIFRAVLSVRDWPRAVLRGWSFVVPAHWAVTNDGKRRAMLSFAGRVEVGPERARVTF
jgi:Tfp pilus assembly protein FimT